MYQTSLAFRSVAGYQSHAMTTHEIRPKQLRALLILLVLVPLIPIALMARFMSDALKGDRINAITSTQQFHAELLTSALRTGPELHGTPAERAAQLLAHIRGFVEPSVAIRIADATGRTLVGQSLGTALVLAQGQAPSGLEGSIQLFLEKPDAIDEAVSGQRRIYIGTGVLVTLLVITIAVTAAMAVSRQIALQELKNTSVETVAHEMRTPLASMRMLTDTLREGRYRGAQQLQEYLDLIANENERLRRIAESFLTFSRLDRTGYAGEFARVSPHEVAAHAVTSLRARLNAPGCSFVSEVPDSLPAIRADLDSLAQVLVNLLDNALKYTGEEKRISLGARAEDQEVEFSVRDNGIGIATDQRRAIFEPFFQADQRLSRSREGSGLGLAIVQRIVKAHGGEITVASELGKGSVFRVKIPIA
jgi:signal transduction histidine kinase